MFNLLCNNTNQKLFKKNFCNESSHYGNYGRFLLQMEAIAYLPQKSKLFVVKKDEWNTKEDTGKAKKNALYVQGCGKRHLSGWSNIEQWKN